MQRWRRLTSSPSIFEQVRGVAAELFDVPSQQLSAESSPETIEGWDSVRQLDLVLELEQRFKIRIEPEDLEQMQTLGQVAELVRKKQGL
jgi:acyl carrier protein